MDIISLSATDLCFIQADDNSQRKLYRVVVRACNGKSVDFGLVKPLNPNTDRQRGLSERIPLTQEDNVISVFVFNNENKPLCSGRCVIRNKRNPSSSQAPTVILYDLEKEKIGSIRINAKLEEAVCLTIHQSRNDPTEYESNEEPESHNSLVQTPVCRDKVMLASKGYSEERRSVVYEKRSDTNEVRRREYTVPTSTENSGPRECSAASECGSLKNSKPNETKSNKPQTSMEGPTKGVRRLPPGFGNVERPKTWFGGAKRGEPKPKSINRTRTPPKNKVDRGTTSGKFPTKGDSRSSKIMRNPSDNRVEVRKQMLERERVSREQQEKEYEEGDEEEEERALEREEEEEEEVAEEEHSDTEDKRKCTFQFSKHSTDSSGHIDKTNIKPTNGSPFRLSLCYSSNPPASNKNATMVLNPSGTTFCFGSQAQSLTSNILTDVQIIIPGPSQAVSPKRREIVVSLGDRRSSPIPIGKQQDPPVSNINPYENTLKQALREALLNAIQKIPEAESIQQPQVVKTTGDIKRQPMNPINNTKVVTQPVAEKAKEELKRTDNTVKRPRPMDIVQEVFGRNLQGTINVVTNRQPQRDSVVEQKSIPTMKEEKQPEQPAEQVNNHSTELKGTSYEERTTEAQRSIEESPHGDSSQEGRNNEEFNNEKSGSEDVVHGDPIDSQSQHTVDRVSTPERKMEQGLESGESYHDKTLPGNDAGSLVVDSLLGGNIAYRSTWDADDGESDISGDGTGSDSVTFGEFKNDDDSFYKKYVHVGDAEPRNNLKNTK